MYMYVQFFCATNVIKEGFQVVYDLKVDIIHYLKRLLIIQKISQCDWMHWTAPTFPSKLLELFFCWQNVTKLSTTKPV